MRFAIAFFLFFALPCPAFAFDFTTGAIIYGTSRFISNMGGKKEKPAPPRPGMAGKTAVSGKLDGVGYEAAFAPNGQALDLVLKLIREARKSILAAFCNIESPPIADALAKALSRGVKVLVVADAKSNSQRTTSLGAMARAGIPVRVNNKYAALHHSYIVVDESHLQLGSFAYSPSANNKNAENVLVLRDVEPLAKAYAREWKIMWDEGIPVKQQ